jgi:hypothetical protein
MFFKIIPEKKIRNTLDIRYDCNVSQFIKDNDIFALSSTVMCRNLFQPYKFLTKSQPKHFPPSGYAKLTILFILYMLWTNF